MFFRLRPEPRLPLGLSLLFLLAIGTYEAGKYKAASEPVRINAIRTVIDAELSRHQQGAAFDDVATGSMRQVVEAYAGRNTLDTEPEELGSLRIAPVFHNGRADAFSLSVAEPDVQRCQALAAFPDSRVTRTLVNGHVVRDGLRIPSGYALLGACTDNATVTLEVSPAAKAPARA
jgi:hypothetical protein